MATKLIGIEEFLDAGFREACGDLVACKGVFDLTHAGHVTTLETASELGDSLVVFLASDSSVRKAKGHGRPILSFHERVVVLNALACVNYVVEYEYSDLIPVLRVVRPRFLCASHFRTLAEHEAALSQVGVQLRLLPRPPFRSTTEIIEIIRGVKFEQPK